MKTIKQLRSFRILLLLTLISFQSVFGQCNLVVNPDFSAGTTANGLNKIPNATSWYTRCPTTPCNGYACGKTGNTPDLMDVNTSNPSANGTTSFPNGPHYPYVGDRWAFFGSIESFYGTLTSSLEVGILYKIRFRLSTSDIVSNTHFRVTLKNGTGSSINCSPSKQITEVDGSFTTSGWDLVTDTFSLTATQGGQNLNRILFEGITPPAHGAHLDSIGIEAYQMIAGQDTALCLGYPYQIGPPNGLSLDSSLYHWVSIPSDASLSGQEHSANPVVTPTTTTSYILAIYDSLNTCGIQSDTITLFDRGCCQPLTGDLIYTDTVLSSAGTVTITSDAAINGLLTLTGGGTFIFDGSDVSLGPEAKIVVESGTALEITGSSHLHACTNMWDEIFVENGAEITVNERSLIEDAEDGLHIEDGANYVLSKANFNKNYRHVTIDAPSGTPIFPVNLIDSCLFLCQTTASIGGTPAYTNLLPPRTSDSTLHGVWAYDVRRLRLGVKNSENYFSNCRFGATAWVVDTVDIQSNTFEDVTYTAISAAECGSNGEVINIYDNQINRTPTGIYCYDNPFAATKILQNRIDYGGMASPQTIMTGIIAIEITPGDISDPNRLSIDRNSIKEAPCGIHVMNLYGWPSSSSVYIGLDTITLLQPSPTGTAHSGIFTENLTLGVIVGNDVRQHNNQVRWWENAIRLEGGVANQVICNDVYNIGNGFVFGLDQRPLSNFAKNKMENNGTGIFFNWAKIGQQGTSGTPNDNEWNGSWAGTNYSTHCYGNGSDGDDSPFYVRNTPSAPSIYIPGNNHESSGAPADIDVNTTSGSWTTGCVYTPPSFKTGDSEQRGLADALSIIAQPQHALATDRELGMQWAGQYNLYKMLLSDEELLNSNNDLTMFLNEKNSGNMGQLHRALSNFQNARQTASQSAGLGQSDHLAVINNIQTDKRPELRLAEVLRILYSNINDLKVMNEGDESRLREIAQLCPIDDGLGVYIARATLLKLDTLPRSYTSDCEITPSPEEDTQWKTDEVQDETTGFRVYPNPNNGRMMVNYNLREGEKGSLVIYNMVGELIFERTLNGSAKFMEIDAANISSGVYLLNIEVNGIKRLTERLSILKE